MSVVLAVLAGGAIGAPLRYLIDRWVTDRATANPQARDFPWGLLVVNVLGSALAGVAFAATSGDLRTFVVVGICGSLTTFSGFAWEADRLRSIDTRMSWLAVGVIPSACIASFAVTWQAVSMLTA